MTQKKYTSVLGLIAAAGLAGCKVGPDYVPPMFESPATYAHAGERGGSASETDGSRAVDDAWWKSLRDPALDALIEQAVRGNHDLKIARSRVVEAMAQRGVIAADELPTLSLDPSMSRTRRSEKVNTFPGSQVQNNWSARFDASWEIDLWGKVARGVEAADAEIDGAVEARRDVLVSLQSEVARNYVELRGFQRRTEIAKKNITLQQESVELTQARFNAGLTSEVDVAQAKSLLATTQSTIPALDAGVQRAIHRLSVLSGRHPGALLSELAVVGEIPAVPQSVGLGLPSELLRRRADVRRAERDLAAATARVGVATADLFPQFSITGAFGFESQTLQNITDPGARFWSFGPAMRWPIFQGGRVRANIGVQNARVEQALVNYERTILTSFEDVENALSAFSREQARMDSLAQAVQSNKRAFELANQLYTNGLTDFLRVLDSQRALFASEDALVDSQRSVVTNLVALYKALGGGWRVAELPAEGHDDSEVSLRAGSE